MADVYYVKLVTGEQLLSGLVGRDDDKTILDNPLELTFDETEDGRSFIYLSRYTPFAAKPKITVRNDHILHLEVAMEDAHVYYDRSLRYCKAKSDVNFNDGVSSANEYIEKLVRDAERPQSAEQTGHGLDDADDLFDAIEEMLSFSKSDKLH